MVDTKLDLLAAGSAERRVFAAAGVATRLGVYTNHPQSLLAAELAAFLLPATPPCDGVTSA